MLLLAAAPALAQAPPFATTKVTDNVYLFRYGGHQSIFVVTPDEKWGNDEQFLPGNIERFCEYWGRGY